nr:MAG TPA: hypothetical protein [Caudoviricetes sp.]DAS13706.1 MAG TPA: hypothetical protein [Caudoviricetes sp.]
MHIDIKTLKVHHNPVQIIPRTRFISTLFKRSLSTYDIS